MLYGEKDILHEHGYCREFSINLVVKVAHECVDARESKIQWGMAARSKKNSW
jgi:hypothetical protein